MPRNKRWSETKTWTKDDGTEVQVEVTFDYSDHGIGPYECHGFKGNHVEYFAEVVNVQTLDGVGVFDDIDDSVIRGWEEKAEPPEKDDYVNDSPPEDDE